MYLLIIIEFNNYLNSTQWQPRGRGRRVLCSVDPDLDLWKILNIKVMYIDLHKIYSYYHFNFLKTYLVEDTQKEISKNILTRHLSDITDVLDPEKLANDLHSRSAGLITFHIKDRVLTTSSYPRYEKVSMLLNDAWRLLRGDEDHEKVIIFVMF